MHDSTGHYTEPVDTALALPEVMAVQLIHVHVTAAGVAHAGRPSDLL